MSSSKESRKKMYSTIYKGITNSLVLLIKHSKLYLPVSIIYKAIQGLQYLTIYGIMLSLN
jgi:hypothetical protein